MNDFYVYREDFDKMWEPAEGGYYVEISTVDYGAPFFFFENAYEKWQKQVQFEKEHCQVYDEGLYISEDGHIYTPHADFLRDNCVGEGWRIGISVGKPEGKQYYGYC